MQKKIVDEDSRKKEENEKIRKITDEKVVHSSILKFKRVISSVESNLLERRFKKKKRVLNVVIYLQSAKLGEFIIIWRVGKIKAEISKA